MTNNESKYLLYSSSQSLTQSTEQLNPSILTMIISAEYSLKKEWDNKLKLIPWEMNSRGTSSRLPVAMTETDSPWNKVSSPTQDLNFYSLQEPPATELKEPEKEKENQSEDALSAPISKTCQSPSSRRVTNKSRASLTPPSQEDWVPREPTISESSTVSKDKKRTNPPPPPLSRRTSLEELSRARRTQPPHWDKRPQRSKDWSPTLDWEERESTRKTRSEDGRRPSMPELPTASWSTNKT